MTKPKESLDTPPGMDEVYKLPKDDQRRIHYDRHSRHFPMSECNQPECVKATKAGK